MSRSSNEVKEYYNQITSIPIKQVAKDLIGSRITSETEGKLLCDCPNHASTSKTSLHVDSRAGLFHCFGCGVGGDVIQFVEFVTDGSVTRVQSGGEATDGHRKARDWIASRLNLPTLAQIGLSPEKVAAIESKRKESNEITAALWQTFNLYHDHLMSDECKNVREWILKQYGFDEKILRDFKIGWAAKNNKAFQVLKKSGVPIKTILGTGAFRVDAHDHILPFFETRVVFPYLSRGKVVYAIGRSTPWSDPIESRAKYKKLQTYNEANRKFVSPTIENSILYGEDVLLDQPERVGITEGVTDCIAGLAAGVPIISPVTVRFRQEDVQTIIRRLRGIKEVVFLQDNEFSGIGVAAALETAELFEAEGVDCRVAMIPLSATNLEAREKLKDYLGENYDAIIEAKPQQKRKLIQMAVVSERVQEIEDALAAAKIDLCEWLKDNSGEDLLALMATAQKPLHVAINSIKKIDDPAEQVESIKEILVRVHNQRPVDKKALFKAIKEKTGLPVGELKSEASLLAKEDKKTTKKTKPDDVQTVAEPGTLAAAIERIVTAARLNGEAPDFLALVKIALDWFRTNGAVIWKTEVGKPMIFFEGEPYEVIASTSYEKHRFQGMFCRTTGVASGTTFYRAFSSNFADLIVDVATIKTKISWSEAFVSRGKVYFSLGDENNTVALMTEDGVEIVANGVNEDAVIVSPSPKMEAIVFDEDADSNDLDSFLDRYIGRHLACSSWEKRLILDWLCCFPLIGLVGTRPMLRFEGEAGSGKTWAAKMLTTLLFGQERQKKSTIAANYVDSERSPLVALDNIETANVTRDLLDFFLTVVTGVEREKRDMNSEGTMSVAPFCLLLTTGIEPLSGDVVELQGRMFLSWFDRTKQAEHGILEKTVLDSIKTVRSRIMSMILKRCSSVLELIMQGSHAKVMKLLSSTLGDHGKKRANDFIALLYLQRIAAAKKSDQQQMFEVLDADFTSMIQSSNRATEKEARESSQIAAAFTRLFTWLHSENSRAENLGLKMNDMKTAINECHSQVLFNAMVQCKRDTGMAFDYRNCLQFGRRMNMESNTLQANGFTVSSKRDRTRKRFYSIHWDGGEFNGEQQELIEPAKTENNPDGAIMKFEDFDQF